MYVTLIFEHPEETQIVKRFSSYIKSEDRKIIVSTLTPFNGNGNTKEISKDCTKKNFLSTIFFSFIFQRGCLSSGTLLMR